MAPTARELAHFAGAWRLDRRITHADGSTATFDGRACWQWQGADLRLCEQGRLMLPGQPPVQAERCYLWAPGLRVHFADGRFFHEVPAQGGRATHWCPPDMYDGWYDFSDWPRFTVTWRVNGPRKSYEMISRYAPEDAVPPSGSR
ncbi:MAG: DUF6314 family protein [Roseovarius sp.]|nr:DUF6314 family protein [Roseovarius sp.]